MLIRKLSELRMWRLWASVGLLLTGAGASAAAGGLAERIRSVGLLAPKQAPENASARHQVSAPPTKLDSKAYVAAKPRFRYSYRRSRFPNARRPEPHAGDKELLTFHALKDHPGFPEPAAGEMGSGGRFQTPIPDEGRFSAKTVDMNAAYEKVAKPQSETQPATLVTEDNDGKLDFTKLEAHLEEVGKRKSQWAQERKKLDATVFKTYWKTPSNAPAPTPAAAPQSHGAQPAR